MQEDHVAPTWERTWEMDPTRLVGREESIANCRDLRERNGGDRSKVNRRRPFQYPDGNADKEDRSLRRMVQDLAYHERFDLDLVGRLDELAELLGEFGSRLDERDRLDELEWLR